jgi:hypothetical protein
MRRARGTPRALLPSFSSLSHDAAALYRARLRPLARRLGRRNVAGRRAPPDGRRRCVMGTYPDKLFWWTKNSDQAYQA